MWCVVWGGGGGKYGCGGGDVESVGNNLNLKVVGVMVHVMINEMEWWNEVVEWSGGMEWWNGVVE